MNSDTQDRAEGPRPIIPLVIVGTIVGLWALSLFLLHDKPERGTFGDMFGAVNALFSGLAFGGVIYAILLQRRELQLQRRELELTRSELEGQKNAMSAQNSTLERQNFESTFFHLLTLHSEIVNSMDLVSNQNRVTKGRDCFQTFYTRFKNIYSGEESSRAHGFTGINRVTADYLKFYSTHQAEIGHYFRSLYNIVKFVDRSKVDDKRFFSNLIRAQLSSYELILLFYNCLSEMGAEKFKPLIEKYSLLKTLPKDKLLREGNINFYERSAFGKE